MNSLRSINLSLLDESFHEPDKGYVLDFSNRTFTDFFIRELEINIDAPQYAVDGVSKTKPSAAFLGRLTTGRLRHAQAGGTCRNAAANPHNPQRSPDRCMRALLATLRPSLEQIEQELAVVGALREKPAGNIRITASQHAVDTPL